MVRSLPWKSGCPGDRRGEVNLERREHLGRGPEAYQGVVAGIGGYGNSIGVPTVAGEVQFGAAYNGNILVNAFALGVAQSNKIFYGRAEGVGNPILYVGARTGRDGIHGATMASAEFGEGRAKREQGFEVDAPRVATHRVLHGAEPLARGRHRPAVCQVAAHRQGEADDE